MQKNSRNILNEFDSLIRSIKENDEVFSQKSIDTEWQRLYRKIEKPKKNIYKKLYFSLSIAAGLILLFAFSYFFLIKRDEIKRVSFETIAESFQGQGESTDITLIIDGKTVKTPKEKSTITYSKNGIVTVDDKKIDTKKALSDVIEASDDYNCVIVPKGKRINLTLSDGTKLYVNSRSRIIYPKIFAANVREVYIEGEAYFEVAHNKDAPFVVKTINLDVEVLGTVFNVSSYKELEKTTITLVEGSVKVTDHKKNDVKLKPSQSVEYTSGKLGEPEHIDVSLHTDWVSGYYIFNSTPLQEVLTKLSFYQDVNFECDLSVSNLMLSGKLDIRTDFDEILQNLSETAGVEFIPKGNGLMLVTCTKSASITNSN